jgi:mannosyltransferase OCH1-like enzyme
MLLIYTSITHLSKASLYGILNIFTVDLNEDTLRHIDDRRRQNRTNEDILVLSNYSQQEFELSKNQMKIYFVQTSENDNILPRHACSIESAARLHPHALIFLFMRSQYVHLSIGAFRRLHSYSNIRFIHFNEQDIYSGTTLAQLNATQRRQIIRYFAVSHMSDFIRTALLYKYGGIYFDLDVIPLKSFSHFTNAVALESSDGVNVAVLAFTKHHIALDIQMDMQLTSMKNPFDTFCWNCLGPSALSDALKHVCDQKKLVIHSKDSCQQIDIQPSFVFYPITYHVRTILFMFIVI